MDDLNQEAATQPVQGDSEGTEPQGTSSVSQETNSPQQTGQRQVETREQRQATSSPTTERPKVSDFYEFRKQVKSLRDQNRQIMEHLQKLGSQFQQPQAPPSAAPRMNREDQLKQYFDDPIGYQERLLNEKLSEREKALKEELDGVKKQFTQERTTSRQREALELIFPRNGTNEDLKTRIAKDPDRYERVDEIWGRYDLDALGDPVKAATIALAIYDRENIKPAATAATAKPGVPNKAQMGSTATAAPMAGGGKKVTLDEIRSKREELLRRRSENPELMHDSAFMKEWDGVKQEFYKTLKEGK